MKNVIIEGGDIVQQHDVITRDGTLMRLAERFENREWKMRRTKGNRLLSQTSYDVST